MRGSRVPTHTQLGSGFEGESLFQTRVSESESVVDFLIVDSIVPDVCRPSHSQVVLDADVRAVPVSLLGSTAHLLRPVVA